MVQFFETYSLVNIVNIIKAMCQISLDKARQMWWTCDLSHELKNKLSTETFPIYKLYLLMHFKFLILL